MRYRRAAQPLKLDGLEAARTFFADCFDESDPARECLWVAHVNHRLQCIRLSCHEGDACGAELPVRTIITDAAVHGSWGLFLAHNHTSGDPTPSEADCMATRRLASAADGLDCKLIDHLIFGENRWVSFRSLGYL